MLFDRLADHPDAVVPTPDAEDDAVRGKHRGSASGFASGLSTATMVLIFGGAQFGASARCPLEGVQPAPADVPSLVIRFRRVVQVHAAGLDELDGVQRKARPDLREGARDGGGGIGGIGRHHREPVPVAAQLHPGHVQLPLLALLQLLLAGGLRG